MKIKLESSVTEYPKYTLLAFIIGGAIGFFFSFNLNWLKEWSPIIQLILFVLLTLGSIILSIETGKVIKNQKNIIKEQRNEIKSLIQEMEANNINPRFDMEVTGLKLLDESKFHQVEVEVEVENRGGRGQEVILKAPGTRLVGNPNRNSRQDKITISEWYGEETKKVYLRLKEGVTKFEIELNPSGVEGVFTLSYDLLKEYEMDENEISDEVKEWREY